MVRTNVIPRAFLAFSAIAVWHQMYELMNLMTVATPTSQHEHEHELGLLSSKYNNQTIPTQTSYIQQLLSSHPPPRENDPSSVWTVSKLTKDHPIPVVLECMGHLGNHLHAHAHGYGLYELALEHGIHIELHFRRKPNSSPPKAKKTIQQLQHCFTSFRDFELENMGDDDDDDEDDIYSPKARRTAQEDWLGPEIASELHIRNRKQVAAASLEKTFRLLQQIILERESYPALPVSVPASEEIQYANSSDTKQAKQHSKKPLSLPFLQVSAMKNYDMLDQHYNAFQSLFAMNERKKACCHEMPMANETVFHFRNFEAELHKVDYGRGYEELPPNQTANELLYEAKQVAIATSFPDHPSIDAYVKAISASKASSSPFPSKVRVISKQHQQEYSSSSSSWSPAIQDFCFMKHAQEELVAPSQSTFSFWAGFLGHAKKVRFYLVQQQQNSTTTMNSRSTLPSTTTETVPTNAIAETGKVKKKSTTRNLADTFRYDWRHPEIMDRIRYELYESSSSANVPS